MHDTPDCLNPDLSPKTLLSTSHFCSENAPNNNTLDHFSDPEISSLKPQKSEPWRRVREAPKAEKAWGKKARDEKPRDEKAWDKKAWDKKHGTKRRVTKRHGAKRHRTKAQNEKAQDKKAHGKH